MRLYYTTREKSLFDINMVILWFETAKYTENATTGLRCLSVCKTTYRDVFVSVKLHIKIGYYT